MSTPHAVNRTTWIALAATLTFGIALRIAHHEDIPSRSPDERVYTSYAARVANEGLRAMPSLFSDYVRGGNIWISPAPTRVGEILLTATFMKLLDTNDARAGADLSLTCSILALFVTAWIGLRFFDPWIAVAATAFLAFSVPELGIARRAWTDAPAGLLSLLLVLVTCTISREGNRRRVPLYVLFVALGMCALLTKEALALYYAICGLWLVGMLFFREKSLAGALALAGGGIASIAAALIALLVCAGDSTTLVTLLPHPGTWLLPHPESWADQNYGGPWYQFFWMLWKVGPLTLALALVGIAAILSGRTAGKIDRSIATLVVASIAAICLAFLSFGPALQCLRMMSPADGCFALMAAVGLSTLLGWARQKIDAADYGALVALSILAVGLEGVRNYGIFTAVVVQSGMEDLAVSGFVHWLK